MLATALFMYTEADPDTYELGRPHRIRNTERHRWLIGLERQMQIFYLSR